MQQPTHLAGFVQLYRIAKKKVVRPLTVGRGYRIAADNSHQADS